MDSVHHVKLDGPVGEETWPLARSDWNATEGPGLKRKIWESVYMGSRRSPEWLKLSGTQG